MRNFVKFSMLALVAVATTASAAELEFHGYARTATMGLNTKGGGSFSFALPGSDRKFRLGNESDYCLEPDFEYKFTTLEDKSAWGVNVMPAFYRKFGSNSAAGDIENLPVYFKQFYFFGNNVPQLLNGQIWIGRRYIERVQTGIDDAFIENEDGDGAGVQDMDLGFAKWSVYVGMNPNDEGSPSVDKTVKIGTHLTGIQTFSKDAALQIWGRVYVQSAGKAPVTTGGVTTLKSPASRDTGFSIAAYHTWNLGDMGSNMLGAKYQRNGYENHADNGAGGNQQGYWAFVQHSITVPSIKTNIEGIVKFRQRWLVDDAKDATTGAVTDWSNTKHNSLIAGVRTDTQLAGPFRGLLEAGYDYDKDSGSHLTSQQKKAQSLLKLTAALAVSAGSEASSRPTFRLFYTQGIWNNAAKGNMGHVWINQDYNAPNNLRAAVAQFDDETTGGTFGFQAEGWW